MVFGIGTDEGKGRVEKNDSKGRVDEGTKRVHLAWPRRKNRKGEVGLTPRKQRE